MNIKWCIGTLFLVITYLSGFYEQAIIPNQEIVIKFVDVKINQNNIKNTITDVQEKLLKIGVFNLKIQETEGGILKISYYSKIHIETIKNKLIKENQFVLNQKSNNSNKNPSTDYNIDIYQLTNKTDILNLDDQFIFEIKNISDRSITNYNYAFARNLKTYKAKQLFKIAYKASKNCPFTKDRTSYKEPEVRAGPENYFI